MKGLDRARKRNPRDGLAGAGGLGGVYAQQQNAGEAKKTTTTTAPPRLSPSLSQARGTTLSGSTSGCALREGSHEMHRDTTGAR